MHTCAHVLPEVHKQVAATMDEVLTAKPVAAGFGARLTFARTV